MRAALVATLALLPLAASCGESTREPGVILFSSRRETPPLEGNSGFGLYALDPETRAVRRLTRPREWINGDFSPSPDGKRVAYAAYTRGQAAWAVGVDGRGRRRIGRGNAVSWSPDGKWIAMTESVPYRLVVVSPDGRGRRVLSRQEVDVPVGWSPDGERLAYVPFETRLATGALVIADADGRSRRIRVRASAYRSPQWSPDGELIAYFESYGPYAEHDRLVVIRPDGSGRRTILPDAYTLPTWSPDGKRLATVARGERDREFTMQVVVVDRDGGNRRPVGRPWVERQPALGTAAPTWSPDGKQIAFTRPRASDGEPYGSDIFVADVEGARERRVTHSFPEYGDNAAPSWVPGRLRGGTRDPRTVPVSPARRLRLRTPLCGLAGGAATAFIVGNGRAGCSGLVAWSPRTGRTRTIDAGCGYPYSLAADGAAAYWVCPQRGLLAFSAGGVRTIGRLPMQRPGGAAVDELVAGDGLVVYARRLPSDWTALPPVGLWRVVGNRSVLIPNSRGLDPLAVRGTLLAGVRPNGTLVVLDPKGRTLWSRPFPPRKESDAGAAAPYVSEAFFDDEGRLAASARGRLYVFRSRDGAPVARIPFKRGTGPPVELVGFARGLAAYVGGSALHILGIRDRRDVVIRVSPNAGDVRASLDARGLVFSYNDGYSRRPGRVVFVRRAALVRALRSFARSAKALRLPPPTGVHRAAARG